MNIKTFIIRFLSGDFNKNSVENQIEAGWYDWFCKDCLLVRKTRKIGNIIKNLKDGGKIDLNNWCVWFKNNCPLSGPLYDDFRFATLASEEIVFTIQIDCVRNKKKYTVFGRKLDGAFDVDLPIFETNSKDILIRWFNEPWNS